MIPIRLPNGYGSVYKLSGKRRKPFVARVTDGWDDEGKQLFKFLGYYEKRQDAMQALADYNANHYNIEASTITFEELYKKYSEKKFKTVEQTTINGYKAAFKHSKALHNVRFVDIKTDMMQDVIDNSVKGLASRRKIKVLFNELFSYAMQRDIVTKDYSQYLTVGSRKDYDKRNRTPFTKEEQNKLWNNLNIPYVDTILILIYTGLRIGELLELKTENIDMVEKTFICGIKTEAGKDRLIPIHDRIYPFFEQRYNKDNEYFLVNDKGSQMKYSNYKREKFDRILEILKMKHDIHDTRHTFASELDRKDVNKTALKRLMGHAINDITYGVYTHKDIEDLREAIALLD